ncbi:MAG: hypothetical protein KJZ69_00670 [Phycisphaerales bacterium]|nr:hypothetical protein [Phycisphaerales bacterium]
MKKQSLAVAAALALVPPAALAQWSEDFESYGDGQLLYHVGGWTGFFDDPAVAARASGERAHSGNRSILIGPGTDAVHPFSGEFTSGRWTLSAWMLMARNDHVEDTYFIVHNEFNLVGPFRWTIEMQFDVSTGTVLDDFRPETPIPIAYDRWARIRIDFDLDNDVQTTWYDGQLLSTGTIRLDPSFPLAIANVNLFSAGATSWYDDIRIVPAPGAPALLGLGALALIGVRRHRG